VADGRDRALRRRETRWTLIVVLFLGLVIVAMLGGATWYLWPF
jgi:heme/copper-type cytochrome/quinol oxidase subunit 4